MGKFLFILVRAIFIPSQDHIQPYFHLESLLPTLLRYVCHYSTYSAMAVVDGISPSFNNYS